MTLPKHLKPQRGLGSAVTSQRRKQRDALRRERERAEDNARNRAREELQRLGRHDYKQTYARAVVASVADNQTAVMRSMELRQSIFATPLWGHSGVEAWTDFRRIVVNYPSRRWAEDPNDRLATIDAIADLRGIIQHEIGHIRFTVPFPELCEQALQERGNSSLHRAWNILEDQRMETLVVDVVPRIATYFTKMIYNHIISDDNMGRSWLLLAGRTYLPADLRVNSHQLFDSEYPSYGIEPFSKQWYDIVKRYKQADNATDMYNCVVEARDFIDRVMPNEAPNGGTGHHDRYNDRWADDQSESESSGSCGNSCKPEDDPVEDTVGTAPSDSKMDKQDDGDDGQEQNGDGADAGAGDGNKAGASSDGDDSEQGGVSDAPPDGPPGGNGVSTADSQRSVAESIRDQINSELEDIAKKHLNDSDNQRMLAGANERMSGEGLPELANSGFRMTPEQLDTANKIAVGIESALTELETASQPAWHSRQDAGVLDALAYRTKQVGSLDYHRRLEGDINAGMDLHVSVLSDISGSMSGTNIQHLSIAMYGMRVACDNLGIKSSFTLWCSPGDTGRIWRHSEPVPLIWDATGGTDPTGALDDLMNHNEENSAHHLVVIFTDGMWGGDIDLSRWSTPNRHIMLCILGYHMDYNADATFTIKSCLELPNKMVDAIKQLNIK